MKRDQGHIRTMSREPSVEELKRIIQQGEARQRSMASKQMQMLQALKGALSEYKLLRQNVSDGEQKVTTVESINNLRIVCCNACSILALMAAEFAVVNTSVHEKMDEIMMQQQEFFETLPDVDNRSELSRIARVLELLQEAAPRLDHMLGTFYDVLSSNISKERTLLISMENNG